MLVTKENKNNQNHSDTQNKQENPLRVLVTRPAHLAEKLATQIKRLGFIPELLPVVTFKPSPHQAILKEAISILNQSDIALFVSATAVQYGMKAILDYWPAPPDILYAAIGPATEQALQSYAVKKTIYPLAPPYESESLLAVPALQNVRGKNCVFFRGNGGRNLLAQTLADRGAKVTIVECYQRQIPKLNIVNKLNSWRQNPIHVILATSADVLKGLQIFAGPENWHHLQKLPMIVVGLRMQGLATSLGVSHIVVAKGADDASLIEALMKFRDSFQ